MDKVLSRRALGRATLGRQLLLERVDLPVEAAVEHVVGLQAQVPAVPYLALWNRLAGFRTDDLSAAMLERRVPDPDTPAPIRFAPEYENALLAYDDRSRVIADEAHEMLPGGHIGTVLVDGLVRATWALSKSKPAGRDEVPQLMVRQSGKLNREEKREIEAEGRRLFAFVRPGGDPVVIFLDRT